MKIFTAKQIREWDQYTIQHEPIASIDLMERAARAIVRWVKNNIPYNKKLMVFCGPGNNGGDGLAVARMLHVTYNVQVHYLHSDSYINDWQINFDRLKKLPVSITEIKNQSPFPVLSKDDVVIEALFGTGLNKPLEGLAASLVHHLNTSPAKIVSIDLPAGLFTDKSSIGNPVVNATNTLSFQVYKLALLLAENESHFGMVELLDIGLHPGFYKQTDSDFETIDQHLACSLYKPRRLFTHKYHYGHALLYAGSNNMMGAALLSAKACLRSGAGLVTLFTHPEHKDIVHSALPEALVSSERNLVQLSNKKNAIGFGPGLENNTENQAMLEQILDNWEGPLVIDATGLQMLKNSSTLLKKRKSNYTILTPHTGEFEKLFGMANDDFSLLTLAQQKATETNCIIVLKGYRTWVVCPDGPVFFNTTGNPGMATAGSGDVLTGILTGLLAQGYEPAAAAKLGVYLHGLAGDLALGENSPESLIAGDITEHLGLAFRSVQHK